MQAVTADTNIYVSALHFGGLPRQFLNAAVAGAFRLAASPPLLAELRRVLQAKFVWTDHQIDEALDVLADSIQLVHPTQTLNVVADDPDDNRILECALEAGSHHIVTGDRHLLSLGAYSGIRILRVAEFMALLAE